MFERYSEPARRVVFWARAEAGRMGSQAIEPEHLLLGLLAEDQGDSARAMAGHVQVRTPPPEPFFSAELAGKLRQAVAASTQPGQPKPEVVDMPVAEGTQRALIAAQERAGDSTVNLLHILSALISDPENSVRGLLKSNGVTVEQVNEAIRARE